MSIGRYDDLQGFHRFVEGRLSGLGEMPTPEECLAKWHAPRLSEKTLSEHVQAVREAFDDIEAGDVGEPADVFLDRFRRENGVLA